MGPESGVPAPGGTVTRAGLTAQHLARKAVLRGGFRAQVLVCETN